MTQADRLTEVRERQEAVGETQIQPARDILAGKCHK